MASGTQRRNAYAVLGLHKGATDEEIKQVYVQLVKKYDPEVHTDRFMVVQNAFDRLKDPERRAREDIVTFNYINGDYLFSKEERVDVPDVKLNQAIEMLEQKHQAEPHNAAVNAPKLIQGYLIRSCKNVQKKLTKEAVDDWTRALAIDPTHQRAKNNMLVAYIRLGYSYASHTLYDEATEVWEKAAQMDPDSHLILQNLALACEFSGRLTEAKRYWEETIRRWKAQLDRNPDDEYQKNLIIEAHRHLAEWKESAPEPTPAHATATASNVNSSSPPSASTASVAANSSVSRKAAAPLDELQQCREILKLRPEDFDASFRMGQILYEQKKWPEAASHLADLHRRFPRNIETLNMLGWAQLNNQAVDLAFKTWERGLKLDPKNFQLRESTIKARMLMGRASRDKGVFINSLVHFKALTEYLADSDEIHYELGHTYKLKGDLRSAYTEYQKAVQINPKHKLARQALSELKMRRA